MRPAFVLLFATVAMAICGFMVFAYFASRPHRLDVAIDKRTGERASFGIYVIDLRATSRRTDSQSGAALHPSTFNTNWPYCTIVAAWDNGRVVRSIGARPEDAEVECVMTSPQIVASVRERLVAAMDDLSRPSEPPFVEIDTSRIVCFAREGDRYRKLECSLSHANRERIEPDPEMVAFLKKWAACSAMAMEVIPKDGAKQVADWLGFERDHR